MPMKWSTMNERKKIVPAQVQHLKHAHSQKTSIHTRHSLYATQICTRSELTVLRKLQAEEVSRFISLSQFEHTYYLYIKSTHTKINMHNCVQRQPITKRTNINDKPGPNRNIKVWIFQQWNDNHRTSCGAIHNVNPRWTEWIMNWHECSVCIQWDIHQVQNMVWMKNKHEHVENRASVSMHPSVIIWLASSLSVSIITVHSAQIWIFKIVRVILWIHLMARLIHKFIPRIHN